jgi:hypothetical protein
MSLIYSLLMTSLSAEIIYESSDFESKFSANYKSQLTFAATYYQIFTIVWAVLMTLLVVHAFSSVKQWNQRNLKIPDTYDLMVNTVFIA